MKPWITTASALLLSCQAAAQTSLFDGPSGRLNTPCLQLLQNGVMQTTNTGKPLLYFAGLQTNNAQTFALEKLGELTRSEECNGKFDMQSNVLTDIVNLGDSAYQVTMKRGANNNFSLESYKAVGAARTSIWTVTNGTNTVYLAGTFHILRGSDYPLPRAFDEVYNKASTVYFEIDFDDPNENGSNLSFADYVDPEGKTLDQVLSPSTYQALASFLAKNGFSITNIRSWSAQMVALLITTGITAPKQGVSVPGVDAHFTQRAQQDKKPILGLETLKLQFMTLHALDEGNEEAMISALLTATNTGGAATDFAPLIQAWRQGDGNFFAEVNEALRVDNQRNYDLTYTNRNNAWLPHFDSMLNTPEVETVFVGAGHLPGPDGLVQLLRQRGYQVYKN